MSVCLWCVVIHCVDFISKLFIQIAQYGTRDCHIALTLLSCDLPLRWFAAMR